MKSMKALFSAAAAVLLALCLVSCGVLVKDEFVQHTKTPLEDIQKDPLAYLNKLAGEIATDAEGFVMETSYDLKDFEAENKTLQEAFRVMKEYIKKYLKVSYDCTYEGLEKAEKKGETLPDKKTSCPALYYTLTAQDVKELTISDMLELRIAEKLEALESDIAQGRVADMKDASDEEKRAYVLDQMDDGAKQDADSMYQIEATLRLEAALQLFAPVDHAEMIEQLKKSEDYLQVNSYNLQPAELTLYARVLKENDRIKDLTITQKSALNTTVTGVNALAEAGEMPVALQMEKTLKYNNIDWPLEG